MAKLTGFKERYIVDKAGKRTAVILDVRDYRQILEEVAELESIRAHHSSKVDVDEREWLRAAAHNPAFAFLKEPGEDIYTLADGKPFHDAR